MKELIENVKKLNGADVITESLTQKNNRTRKLAFSILASKYPNAPYSIASKNQTKIIAIYIFPISLYTNSVLNYFL